MKILSATVVLSFVLLTPIFACYEPETEAFKSLKSQIASTHRPLSEEEQNAAMSASHKDPEILFIYLNEDSTVSYYTKYSDQGREVVDLQEKGPLFTGMSIEDIRKISSKTTRQLHVRIRRSWAGDIPAILKQIQKIDPQIPTTVVLDHNFYEVTQPKTARR